MNRFRAVPVFFMLGGLGLASLSFAGGADQAAEAAAYGRAVTMQSFMVSATRIAKNPWYYASLPGLEVLSRASDEKTIWWLDARVRGRAVEDAILPKEWLPEAVVPHTIIIDDSDMRFISASLLHSRPIVFAAPPDAVTWGELADRANLWSDHFEAQDYDTYAINSNVYGVDTREPACAIGLGRLSHCTPALPRWAIDGLVDPECGLFRESFIPLTEVADAGRFRKAVGPGTMWVSLEETQRLLEQFRRDKTRSKDKRSSVAMPPLGTLFAETPPGELELPLWESEAALFMRWDLAGPGHDDPPTARAFLEFVDRARRSPVDEQVFKQCFGFGYTQMEDRLGAYLRVVLAQPDTVELNAGGFFFEPEMKEATSDQIGRILGDWLRMQSDSIRKEDPGMADDFLEAAGRMLERAYRDDNGLPPDVAPPGGGELTAAAAAGGNPANAVVMKPFVVTANHLHDPALLAVYGLYEHDSGHEEKAREFLRAAIAAGAVRPRANLILAKLLYSEAIAHPDGLKGLMGKQQLDSILGVLDGALQFPPASEVYALKVYAWLHSDAVPARHDVQEFAEGVALFPRNAGLAYLSAEVCSRAGYVGDADELIAKGVPFAPNDKAKAYFTRLRANLKPPQPTESQ